MIEGDFRGKCVSIKLDVKVVDGRRIPKVKATMQVTDGQYIDGKLVEGKCAGETADFGGKMDQQNIQYTKRYLMALGWAGRSSKTIVSDVMAANRTVNFEARIASNTYADSGKTSTWSAVQSIGRDPKPPIEEEDYDKLDQWFGEVPAPSSNDPIPF